MLVLLVSLVVNIACQSTREEVGDFAFEFAQVRQAGDAREFVPGHARRAVV